MGARGKLYDSPDSKGIKIIKWPNLMSQPHKETYLNLPKNIREVLFWHITAKWMREVNQKRNKLQRSHQMLKVNPKYEFSHVYSSKKVVGWSDWELRCECVCLLCVPNRSQQLWAMQLYTPASTGPRWWPGGLWWVLLSNGLLQHSP